jgi:superfamily II DNA/RNA helicase
MERSLDLGLLTAALAGRTGLPSAEELQHLMAEMEVQLFLRRPELDSRLLDAAWYLHGIASVDQARERYTPQRQRQAFAVSSHIFDLVLQQDGWSRQHQLSLGFAASIGYRRGGRDPNATAILNRLRSLILLNPPVTAHVDTLSLEAGLAFLGFQTRSLFSWFRTWRGQLAALARESALDDLASTILGPAQLIVLGADDLLTFFTDGSRDRLERGRTRLSRVVNVGDVPEDLNARWVAAHLLALIEEAYAGSLWNPLVIPPSVPELVRRAFTVGTPAVLTLWEPQRDLLTGERSPFDPKIRRMVLAVPTSGGKTLLAQLLAVEQLERADSAVCYVAPTRSLGREVRQAMASRVRMLEKETGADQPDFPSELFGGFRRLVDQIDPGPPPDVEVMTPERLANLLRHDSRRVLDRFGMFIFDEAQQLKESSRGFVLESTIAMLDYLTHETEHRLVLISAAMGNAGAIASWIRPHDQLPLLHESAWRGPRRLHAVFTTNAEWENTSVTKLDRARVWPYRHTTELSGLIRLRLANGRTTRLTTDEDTGWRLVRKAKSADRYPAESQKDTGESTRQYKIAAEMIALLGHAGSVLVVASTRAQAQQVAMSLAEAGQEQPALAPTVDFVRGQLGADHPLVKSLHGGVGFHHAGLPTEVQEALEQAVRDDVLPYLTCTSTLTDGINLPVRTVVIYDTPYEGQPDDVRLRGARLVNAIGRAGRAGKETEGWIVLARTAEPSERDFTDLDPDADTLAVTSSLITEEALQELAALEHQLRDDEDAIFRDKGRATTNFISFVWLMLAVEEERGTEPGELDVTEIVDSTLAALQSEAARQRFLHVAKAVQGQYRNVDPAARRRWPRTGTSVGSARTIDELARGMVDTIASRAQRGMDDDLGDPGFLLQFGGGPEGAARASRGARVAVPHNHAHG